MKERLSGDLPWKAMLDYVGLIGQARTRRELLRVSADGLRGLVPFEAFAGVFTNERRLLGGTPEIEAITPLYEERFRPVCPPYDRSARFRFPGDGFYDLRRLDFDDFSDSEFHAEFCVPCRVRYALVFPIPGSACLPGVFRPPSDAPFSAREEAILGCLAPHIRNLLSVLDRAEAFPAAAGRSPESIRERFPRLSRREAEVASLLCGGYSSPEIADVLFLSRRTVETHVFHIFCKLGARNRRGAIAALLGSP